MVFLLYIKVFDINISRSMILEMFDSSVSAQSPKAEHRGLLLKGQGNNDL